MRRPRVILGFLLVYQAFFLNVVLPGHTRGAVTTDGIHSSDTCCCCGGDRPSVGKQPGAPSQRDREHCAICQFAVGLISVPLMRLTLSESGLLEVLPVAGPKIIISLERISTYLACGPPASVACLCV